mmetsp:Transcript_16542/g.40970  ORF Transcript_16542/g.40970 Transcript_16542/m.40970 type:complete len:289 (+) Transcript_16542:186-1052(+)
MGGGARLSDHLLLQRSLVRGAASLRDWADRCKAGAPAGDPLPPLQVCAGDGYGQVRVGAHAPPHGDDPGVRAQPAAIDAVLGVDHGPPAARPRPLRHPRAVAPHAARPRLRENRVLVAAARADQRLLDQLDAHRGLPHAAHPGQLRPRILRGWHGLARCGGGLDGHDARQPRPLMDQGDVAAAGAHGRAQPQRHVAPLLVPRGHAGHVYLWRRLRFLQRPLRRHAGEAPHRGALPGALPAEHASLHGGEVEPRPAGPAWGRPHPEHFSRHRATRVLGRARLTLHALAP